MQPDRAGETSPTAAHARPLPPPTPKSILKIKKRSISVGEIKDGGSSTGPVSLEITTPTRPRGASTSAAATSTSPSALGTTASPTQLVAHPALRGVELNLAQLARQSLALPAGQFADDDDGSQYSSNDSPDKFNHPRPAPAPPGDPTWPQPLNVTKVPSPTVDDKEGSITGASGADDAAESLPGDKTTRSAMGLLRSGLRSAENLFSKFKDSEKPRTGGRIGPEEPSDDMLSIRSTPKSVRFKGIEDIFPSRETGPLSKLFSKKTLEVDPWEYTRAYEIDKVKAASEGRAPRLPPPGQRWKWKDRKDNRDEIDFSIRPQTPINVHGLPEASFIPPQVPIQPVQERQGGDKKSRTPEEVQEFIHDLQKTVSEQMQDV